MSSSSIPRRSRRVFCRRRNALRPLMEPLERRIQLSVTPLTSVTAITNSSSSSGIFNQSSPSVAMDAEGDYVVTWVDDLSANGYTTEIEAQVFNPNGTAKTGVIEVNSSSTPTNTTRTQPSVAMDANGDFVVAWSLEPANQPAGGGYYYDIEARRFNLAGMGQGSEFQVNNTQTTIPRGNPTVAMDNSNFVVGWVYNDGVNATVHARLYSFSGTTNTPLATEFNVSPALRSFEPDVAMDSNGDFVFTWDTYNPTAMVNNVFAQAYNASAVVQQSPIEIDSTASTINPSVAMNAAGDFVIAFEIYKVVNNSAYSDVYAQQYDLTGSETSLSPNPLGGDVEVYPQNTSFVQEYPSAAIDAQGFATVVWDDGTSSDASDDLPIDAIRVNPNGTVIESSPIQVAPPVVNLEYGSPKVAGGANGNLAFAWQTYGDVNPTSGYGENIDERPYEYINNAPTLNTLSNVTMSENGSTTVPLSGINAGGNEQQTLTVTAASSNAALIVPTITYTSPNATGTLNLAPIAGQFGTATITVTVTDSGGTANGGVNKTSVQFTLKVVGLPKVSDQSVNVPHDSSGTGITLYGSDPNSPPLSLTFAMASSPTHGTITSFNTSSGAATYKPAAGYHGTDSFAYLVTNSAGLTSPTAVVTLNVAVATPTANGQTVSVAHDSAGTPITLTSSDDDTPTLTQTFVVASQPAFGSLSGTAPNLTYIPAAGYHGTDSFTFTVSNGTNTSAPATITLNVAVGTPTANAQTVAVAHDSAGTPITLTETDDDDNYPNLTQTFVVANQPAHGTLSGTAPNLTYTPAAGYHGTDSFTFTDSNGTNTSAAATVTLNVAVGTPTANAQTVPVAHDSSGTAITLNSTDDDTPALTQTYALGFPPGHGTITSFNASTGAVTYKPTAGYHGSDSFTFTVKNGTNTSSFATVTLNVAVGTPTANNGQTTVAVAHDSTGTPITLTGSDDDSPILAQTFNFTQPSHGTVTVYGLAGSPSVIYTPNLGYHGVDSFTFTDGNGTNTSAPATVNLNVAIGTPTAIGQTLVTNQNTPLNITLKGSDDDTPALAQTFVVATQPANGTVTLSGPAGSPTVVYTPNTGFTGPDSFTFTESNGVNTSAPATVNISVASTAATVSGTVGITWGTAGTATLQTNGDGLRLLPTGRNTDLPWLGINTLSITLSQAETLSPTDVSVTGITIASYGPVTISGSGTNYVITLAQPINAADRVTVTIGNANIATYTRRLDVLPGDFDDNGVVNAQDAVLVRNMYLGLAVPNVFGDINGDGTVDLNDYNTVRRLIGTALPPLA